MMCFIQQLGFCIVQFLGKIHIYLMWIEETFCLIPKRLFFLTAEFCNLLYRWGLILTFSMLEDWDKQFTHCVGSTRKKCFLPCSIWVKEKKIFLCIKCLISKADQIGTQHTSLFVVNAIDSFISWIGDLFNVFRNFNLRLEFSICILNSSQFINTAKGRAVF